MKKILVAGDWHGNSYAAQSCMEDAERENCDAIFQVGDFGVSFGIDRPIRFVTNVSNLANRWGIPVYFIDGNHENFDAIGEWVNNADRDENGHIEVATNLFYVPRGSVWRWGDKTFAAMGGAASIDRDWRTEGFDYFPQELISYADGLRLIENDSKFAGRIDYFFTHDCSDRTPWGFQLVPDILSQRNRQTIDNLLNILRPRYHFHGHMHKMYDWWENYGQLNQPDVYDVTHVYGLNFENERHSRGVLDVSKFPYDEFSFVPWKRRIDPLDPKW